MRREKKTIEIRGKTSNVRDAADTRFVFELNMLNLISSVLEEITLVRVIDWRQKKSRRSRRGRALKSCGARYRRVHPSVFQKPPPTLFAVNELNRSFGKRGVGTYARDAIFTLAMAARRRRIGSQTPRVPRNFETL